MSLRTARTNKERLDGVDIRRGTHARAWTELQLSEGPGLDHTKSAFFDVRNIAVELQVRKGMYFSLQVGNHASLRLRGNDTVAETDFQWQRLSVVRQPRLCCKHHQAKLLILK
ncbi:hypothetical protein PQR63_18815 [Herbaspirillum rhizosphaerae]|uniref:Uncharacterized protein n=1 Tax=Herbaspirillum rhizosphaerae TaxID=346179 RepID=A0ABW8ZC00_9BURK